MSKSYQKFDTYDDSLDQRFSYCEESKINKQLWVMGRCDFYCSFDDRRSFYQIKFVPKKNRFCQNPVEKTGSKNNNGRKFGFKFAPKNCYSFWTIVAICLILQIGSATSCPIDSCATEFTRDFELKKVTIGPNIASCILLNQCLSCLDNISPQCRGDIRFLGYRSIIKNYFNKDNCSNIIDKHRKANSRNPGFGGSASKSKCLFPYQPQISGEANYRYCSAFGDPHLRTFDGRHETCKTLGAWPLVDNAYLTIQMVCEAFTQGLNVSAITKVSVIIKDLPGCTGQKMYEANSDNLPSSFDDGSVHSGEPSTSNGDTYLYFYGDGLDAQRPSRIPPALFIETVNEGDHVEIHLRYVSTRIILRRFGRFLSVALKMPEEALAQESTLSRWQLCLSGCPPGEKIDFRKPPESRKSLITRVPRISGADSKVGSNGVITELMPITAAEAICRAANVTGFFFDSCVFDMVLSDGNTDFRDSARAALYDIRRIYPPYKLHYEANRTELGPYAAGFAAHIERLAESRKNAPVAANSATMGSNFGHVPLLLILITLPILLTPIR